MATVTFDTLKFVEKLRTAGVPEAQAKAQAEVLVSALSEAIEVQLATKTDIAAVKADIAQSERAVKADITKLEREVKADIAGVRTDMTKMDRELYLIKWMMGMVVAGVTALILEAFFGLGK
jgi:hypothetical protein